VHEETCFQKAFANYEKAEAFVKEKEERLSRYNVRGEWWDIESVEVEE
jgi:hypothetical protein